MAKDNWSTWGRCWKGGAVWLAHSDRELFRHDLDIPWFLLPVELIQLDWLVEDQTDACVDSHPFLKTLAGMKVSPIVLCQLPAPAFACQAQSLYKAPAGDGTSRWQKHTRLNITKPHWIKAVCSWWSTGDPTAWEIVGEFGRACQVELRPDTVGRLGPFMMASESSGYNRICTRVMCL